MKAKIRTLDLALARRSQRDPGLESWKLLVPIKPCCFTAVRFGHFLGTVTPQNSRAQCWIFAMQIDLAATQSHFLSTYCKKTHPMLEIHRDVRLRFALLQFVLPHFTSVNFYNFCNACSKQSSKTVYHNAGRWTLPSLLQHTSLCDY